MNKIKTKVNKDTNYIFHMLSAARCGYDNSYGERYRSLHKAEDLNILKKYEELITVKGGEHCGKLYSLLVAVPACGKCSAKEYYTNILSLFQAEPTHDSISEYIGFKTPVMEIAAVMAENYDVYESVWEKTEKELVKYAEQVEAMFTGSGFTEKCEKLVGQVLKTEYFYAAFTNSVAYGPEAIDISEEQDMFGIDRTPEDAFYFIGHEFIIYLLMEKLKGTSAFHSFEAWSLTEGLAEFYLIKVMGDSRFFNEQLKYAEYYRECFDKDPALSAKELFLMAEEKFAVKRLSNNEIKRSDRA